MLAIVARKALLPWETIKAEPLGCFHDPSTVALPRDPATAAQFTTMPDDVRQEVAELLADAPVSGAFRSNGQSFSFLTSSRRQRHRFNSIGFKISKLQRAMPYNCAYLNPVDMEAVGIAEGDWVEITSDHGTITVLAQEDGAMRRGVVSICHGFGGLPDEDDFLVDGVSPNQLISTDRDLQTINGQPRMSGIPVNVRRAKGPARASAVAHATT
jgi:hypothetical protein